MENPDTRDAFTQFLDHKKALYFIGPIVPQMAFKPEPGGV
jgi:hypothetical protein